MDPTKWVIWTLAKLRLVRDLRRVPADRITTAERAITLAAARAGR